VKYCEESRIGPAIYDGTYQCRHIS